MGIKAKILKELQKKPRRLKELKAKLGNDKKVARAVDELVERNKVVCRKGVYAVPDPKTGSAVECTLVKLAGKFGFARPVQPGGQDIFIPGKYLMGAMPGDRVLLRVSQRRARSEGENLELEIKGRHDPVIVPRAVVVVEAMAALTITDALFNNMSARMDRIHEFYHR